MSAWKAGHSAGFRFAWKAGIALSLLLDAGRQSAERSRRTRFVELRGDTQGGKSGLDRVRQAFHSVTGLRPKVERSAPVEREPERNRNALHPWVFKGGDGGRKGTQLSVAATNRLATTWHLHGSLTRRPTGVRDGSTQSAGGALPDPRLSEVIRSQLMDQCGRRSNPSGKVRVERRRSHNGKKPGNQKDSGLAVSESESRRQRAGRGHREPFVERQ